MSLGEELAIALAEAVSGRKVDRAEVARRRILRTGCPVCGDRVSAHGKSGWCHRCGWAANWDGSAGSLS